MKTVLFVLLVIPILSWSQRIKITPEDTYRKRSYLLMRDGSVMRGQIVRQDSSLITVRVKGGDLSFVEADQVVRISPTRPGNIARGETSSDATGRNTVFRLKDGSQVAGTFVRRDSTMITVRKRNGRLTYFEPELLVRVDTVQASPKPSNLADANDQVFTSWFSPWLVAGQTAYNAEKGRFYYRNTFLLLNEFDYGITRHWSIGATVNPFFKEFESNSQARETILGATVRFSSKLTFPIGKQFRFGVNAIYRPSQKGYFYRLNQQIVLQGLMSFGDSQRNATLGYGVRILPDYTATSNRISFISVGVMHKISRNLTFLSDNTFNLNLFYGNTSAELSLALRLNRRRHAFDLGALSATQINPIIDYRFGPYNSGTRTYFSPYIAYNLLIGRD